MSNPHNRTDADAALHPDNILLRLLQTELPNNEEPKRTVLWLGDLPNELFEQLIQQLPADITQCHHLPESNLERYDIAVVYYQLAGQPNEAGMQLLARLRDLLAPKIIAVLKPKTNWQLTDFLALGFTSLNADIACEHNEAEFYGFDISNYKQTPDWLNSKYWANPRLWDKHRW